MSPVGDPRSAGTRPDLAGRARMVAGIVAAVTAEVPVSGARVALHQPTAVDLGRALRDRLPDAMFVDVPPDPDQAHLLLAAAGPFDVVVDREQAPGRVRRLKQTLFHLRPGGAYVVPDGAHELSDRPGPLGRLLAAPGSGAPLRTGRQGPVGANLERALHRHARAEVREGHLLVRHDLTDVRSVVREEHFDRYLDLTESADRVVQVLPAGPPPVPPTVTEGPMRRAPDVERPIDPVTPTLRIYHDVLAAPRQLLLGERVVCPDTFRHGGSERLRSSRLLGLGPRFAVPAVPIDDPPRLPGTWLYLDNEFRGHFGHLITESLSRAWTWPHALEVDPSVRVLLGSTSRRPELLDYELELYDAAGIPRDRIELIRGPVRVERLISGTQLFGNPHYVHQDQATTWLRMGEELARRAGPDPDRPRRVFLSRRTAKRACVNGGVVESLFAEHGFAIIHPEELSVPEQVAVVRAADVVGGYVGSALFSMAFVPGPTRMVVLTPSSYAASRNEYLIAAVHGHPVDYVVSQSLDPDDINSDFVFDVDHEGRLLHQILAGLG